MRRTRCSVWAPACDHLERVGDLPVALRGLLERLPNARGGLKLLGGAVQGALEVDTTVDEIGLRPALKRARRAAQLADRIRESAIAAPVPQTAHLAWLLLSKCVNHALSFDARLVGEEALTAANGIAENALWPAMHAILSVDITAAARRRMRISGAYGGCGLRAEASGAYAHAAHYAAWLSKATRVVAIASFTGRPIPRCHGGPEAAKAQEGLRRAGVMAANDGAVGLVKDAAAEYATSALQRDQPINELGRLHERGGEVPRAADGAAERPGEAAPQAGFPHVQAPGRDRGGGPMAWCGARH